jgi:hypothetical protein
MADWVSDFLVFLTMAARIGRCMAIRLSFSKHARLLPVPAGPASRTSRLLVRNNSRALPKA